MQIRLKNELKRSLYFYFIWAIFGFNNLAQGQYLVNARIEDQVTKEPLQSALVRFYNNKSLVKGSISDRMGNIKIDVPYFNSVEIQMLGYETIEYASDTLSSYLTKDFFVFAMSPTNQYISDNIVVSAGRKRQKQSSLTVSMESIKPYLIENKNTVRIDQIMNQIPGVNVTDGQANIRNGSGWSYGAGSRVMVLLDGMPMMSGDAGQVLWSFLPIDNLANTEVIKGASSVLYGSSALNGLIHIQSKEISTKPTLHIRSFFGAYDYPSSHPSWNNSLNYQTGLLASFSQKIDENSFAITGNLIEDLGYRMGEVDKRKRLGFVYEREINKKFKAGLNTNAMLGESGSFLLWQSLDSGYTALNNETTMSITERFHIDPYVHYKHKNSSHTIRTRYLYINNQINQNDPNNDQSNSSNYLWGEYQLNHKLESIQAEITTGILWSHVTSQSPLYNGFQTSSNKAAFFQLDKHWKKLKFNIGVRLEEYSINKTSEKKPVFRSGLNYEVNSTGNIRTSFGQGYRFPTIAEQFITTTVGPVSVLPNPDLASETGWNFEMGYSQGFSIKKIKVKADVTLFRMEYNNMMEFTFGQWLEGTTQNPLGVGFKSLNVGRSRIDGLEISLLAAGKINRSWTIEGIGGLMLTNPVSLEPDAVFAKSFYDDPYTFNNTSYDPSNNRLKYRATKQYKFDIQSTYRQRAEVGLSYRYSNGIRNIDRAFVSFPLNTSIKDIEQGLLNTALGIHIFDIRIGYQFVKQKIKISLIGQNILNKIYMERPADLRPPRLLVIQLRYQM